MWRITTYSQFNGTWLSDFVPNELGVYLQKKTEVKTEKREKPDCELIGQDGNIFNLMGIASRTLKQNGLRDEASEMTARIVNDAGSYEEALHIIGEYVNITGPSEDEDMSEGEGVNMQL